MAVVGTVGQDRELFARFYKNGTLFNPFSFQTVKIFDAKVGGTLIATLAVPSFVNVGQFNVIWSIPGALAPGRYYHEWAWEATATAGVKVQRYIVDVIPVIVTAPTVKSLSSNLAVGWWGRDISKRIDTEQIPTKVKALLTDKLLSRGKDIFLWQEVDTNTPNVLTCSCVKDTTQRADITCNSCYGVKLIPGYKRFAHETIFSSSISSGLTLVNTVLDTSIKPHRLLLSDTFLTGTIESGAIAYSNLLSLNWDFKSDIADIKSTNTVLVEFSTDDITFFPISQLNDTNKKPINVGNVFLRITLTRASANDRSPEFEIIRLRHANVLEPFIKILRPQVSEFPSLMQYGGRVENIAERFWTMPLDFFDTSITQDTPAARILENSFYERVKGINAGNRFVTTKLNYNEEFGTFTEQSFETRRAQPEEVYARLVF